MDIVGIAELTELVQTELTESGIKCTKKDTKTMIQAVFNVTASLLAEDKVQVRIPDFGSFTPTQRAARTAHDPRNPGTKIDVPEKVVVTFKMSKSLKDQLPASL